MHGHIDSSFFLYLLPLSFLYLFICLIPVDTFVHAMLGSGFPVASQGRNTSLSASTDTLAAVTVVILAFAPPPLSPNCHGNGGAAVGRRELIRPAKTMDTTKK